MTESQIVYNSAVKQLAHHEDRLAKLRHGLRELKLEAAAQTCTTATATAPAPRSPSSRG